MANPTALLCLACSLLAGWAGNALGVPLAWVLGPMSVTAAFAIAGTHPFAPLAGRRFGQLVIGAAIGLNLTWSVLVGLVAWVPLMVITALVSMLASSLASIGFARAGRIDVKTAYFAMLPGGLSEMANIGAATGARSEPIALSQAVRVAIVVCVLPPFIVSLGIGGDFYNANQQRDLPFAVVPVLLAAGFMGVLLVRFLRLNNPWMIGAILGVAVLAAAGVVEGRMPRLVFYLGQFLLGIAIGARFRREIVSRLLRLTLVSAAFVLVLTMFLFAYAALLAGLTGIDIASATLAASPGGFAEMAVTAKALHLEVALVTMFHLVRAFLVNGFAVHYWHFLYRIGFFDAGRRVLDSIF